ncbi:hypothetical protein HMPREF0758_4973 [Serratia odorifera DSM 4582]|uniref:DDE domain-containing protein n=1 Tax=Serratia odorifera DSM 4582 TaxID=667129 RepID=D4E9X3_SEROD|nr:hypothetical protein HMPREF0758_4973 [Serratia odorifera DSM 4582]
MDQNQSQWKSLYRAVDTAGQTIEFLLIAKRDTAAALSFFRKAIRHHGKSDVVTIDKVVPTRPLWPYLYLIRVNARKPIPHNRIPRFCG